jgi:thiol-disulfide isomerase/thioredoxin
MNSRYNPLASLFLPAAVLISLGAPLCQAHPANDMFASRTVISGTNIVDTGSNVGATRETGEPYHAGFTGGASVWWSWRAPFAGTATISTAGSSFDTLLGVYTGTSVSALTEIASNDDDPTASGRTSRASFGTVSNQTYQIAVDGYSGDSGSIRLSVQLGSSQPLPPAPAWRLADPYGSMVDSTNLAGKVVIVDFWATWCGPCKAAMPDLVALQSKYCADGLVVVGANVSWSYDSVQTVIDFLAAFTPTINYQIVMSDAATDSAFGGISAIPTLVIIDRQNFIRQKYVGSPGGSALEKQIIPLLYGKTRLACQRSGNQMVFRWPTNAQTFTLESASTLTSSTWSTWPTGPTVVNGTNIVQVPMTNAPRCFRLRMPY